MEAMQIQTTETLLEEYLKRRGQYFSGAGRTVVQAFMSTTEPISTLDLAFSVKRLDPLVSIATVRRFLGLLKDAGLAMAIPPTNRAHAVRFELVRDPKPTETGDAKMPHMEKPVGSTAIGTGAIAAAILEHAAELRLHSQGIRTSSIEYTCGAAHEPVAMTMCVPAAMLPAELEQRINAENLTGQGPPWKVATTSPCKDDPERLHYGLLVSGV